MVTQNNIINSMLWSCYGDAMGYITELCDDKRNLAYRTHGLDHVTELIKWQRKLGGQYGVYMELPQGCYSDDTQMRLAVCRSINKNGKFDFETFSKIEVPVFLAYGLGVGKGTRDAGSSLVKKTVQWNTNFYETEVTKYVNGGGNGAAMRIQPHVWATPPKVTTIDLIREIMRDVLITHGHPIAWVGAVFHALILRATLSSGHCPGPDSWDSIADESKSIVKCCQEDILLKDIWVPNWERLSGKSISIGVSQAIDDMKNDIKIISNIMGSADLNNLEIGTPQKYKDVVSAIDAFNPKFRGSATKTALLATYISYYFSKNLSKGIEICANTLGSDTDTIASMAGAIMGAGTGATLPQKILDYEYLVKEAQRLYDISNDKIVNQFIYPDLLQWNLPKSQIDYTGYVNNGFAIYGLGMLEPQGEPIPQKIGTKIIHWRFFKTTFGQTLLLKYRPTPPTLLLKFIPPKEPFVYSKSESEKRIVMKKDYKESKSRIEQMVLYQFSNPPNKKINVDDLTDILIKNGFREADIGRQLLSYAEEEDGIEKAIAFVSIIIKAKRARLKKDNK